MKKLIGIILIWLLVIEGSLHLTAFGIQFWMKPSTDISLANKSEIKILCIGESTTVWGGDDAYPAILQRKLDSLSSGLYHVVNRGLPGANTHRILKELPYMLDEVRPQIVILMTGINDYWATIDKDASFWQKSLEQMSRYSMLAKLTRNVLVNIEYGKKTDEEMSQAANCGGYNAEIEKYVKEAEEIKNTSNVDKTIEYLEAKIALLTPNGVCSIADKLQYMLISLQEHEKNDSTLALATVEKILSSYMIPYKRSALLEKRNYLRMRLGLISEKVKPEISAENYWENSTYKINIQHILKQMQSRSIPVIMMQYPRLPIEPLKVILLDHNGVNFVENKVKFEEALKTKTFDDLFHDHFATVFGHFKPFAADLVAEEVMKAVIKKTETQGVPGFHK